MEPSEPELERTARRVRRAVLAFRLIFYSGAVLAIVLLLASRGDGHELTYMRGTTSQGASFDLRIDADGQPGRLATEFRMKCPGGMWTMAWWPYGPFRLHDDALTIHETTTHTYDNGETGHRTVTFHATIKDHSVRGTMEAVEKFEGSSYGPYSCASGPLGFSAVSD